MGVHFSFTGAGFVVDGLRHELLATKNGATGDPYWNQDHTVYTFFRGGYEFAYNALVTGEGTRGIVAAMINDDLPYQKVTIQYRNPQKPFRCPELDGPLAMPASVVDVAYCDIGMDLAGSLVTQTYSGQTLPDEEVTENFTDLSAKMGLLGVKKGTYGRVYNYTALSAGGDGVGSLAGVVRQHNFTDWIKMYLGDGRGYKGVSWWPIKDGFTFDPSQAIDAEFMYAVFQGCYSNSVDPDTLVGVVTALSYNWDIALPNDGGWINLLRNNFTLPRRARVVARQPGRGWY